MKLVCPCCGATLSIEALLQDSDARSAVQAALCLPPSLGGLVLRYIGLFRPPKRALSWDRASKLLSELQSAIDARSVERHGMTYTAPLELWQAAIEQMLAGRDKLQLPLKSHGYLFEVVAGMANKAGAKAEQRKEEQLRRRPREGVEHNELKRLDTDAARTDLKSLRRRLGGSRA